MRIGFEWFSAVSAASVSAACSTEAPRDLSRGARAAGADRELASFSPRQALTFDQLVASLRQESWKFIGRALVDTDHVPSCAWKAPKAILLSDYCTNRESPAMGSRILLQSGEVYTFYLEKEPSLEFKSIVDFRAEDYRETPSWELGYLNYQGDPEFSRRLSEVRGIKDLKRLKTWMDTAGRPAGCFIGGLNHSRSCSPELIHLQGQWLASGQAFWRAPPPAWTDFLRTVRAQILEVTSN